MTIEEKQQEIIDEFTIFEDWMDKYQYLVDLSKSLKPFPEEYRTDDNLIKGCQSRVWIFAVKKDGKINFYGDSDAIIVKGIVSLLINVFSGFTPEEILKADFNFIDEIGLKEHLSPTRSNGLLAMVKQMRLYALAFSAH
ncbi:MAG: SufE family protein [Paludibacteraceae bacterium]|jgi:cysteine desulfuration protein SufE|nr:SufE family protein [Paludibacteraceae bacterium]MDI9536411.1 SufE family protein [Bacteroidota bacterium]HHT61488.1 SufE family protein [Bacteroidales bacterium]MBP9038813.1 SufE family protein [Paludibacteraceae bacterium]HOA46010.1 SufE family protein [Paludibacteraceae bacterium]